MRSHTPRERRADSAGGQIKKPDEELCGICECGPRVFG